MRLENGLTERREPIVFAGRPAAGFDKASGYKAIILHAAHQGIDRAFTHTDSRDQGAGDFIAIALAP